MASDIPPDALRERLAAALSAKGSCQHAGADSCEPWWAADAAIPAVAAWLRDKAAADRESARRDLHQADDGFIASDAAQALRNEAGLALSQADHAEALADEIDPPKGDET